MSGKTAFIAALAFALAAANGGCATAQVSESPPTPAARQSVDTDTGQIRPVRNQAADTAQIGSEGIVTLRYWKIRKGGFPQFLAASQHGVWPYFEKIGARVLGMWMVQPTPGEAEASADYDEVYLATRYASVEHWAATRDAVELGGNGPDFDAMRAALAIRRELTLETNLTFLEGVSGPVGPYFLPGTGEMFVPDR